MNKKTILAILAVLCFAAAAFMYRQDRGNLTELKEFWYAPLILGVLALIAVTKGNNKKNQ